MNSQLSFYLNIDEHRLIKIASNYYLSNLIEIL